MWDSQTVVETETNPLRVARKRHHKSLHDMCKDVGVNYQTLYLNECGVFPTILPKIRRYLINEFELDGTELDKLYRKFVLDKRRVFALQYSDKVTTLPEPDITFSPFRLFRVHIDPIFQSRTAFCKTICIEPAGMFRVENGPIQEIPKRISEAFLQVGVPSDNLQELKERQYEFYARSR